MAEFAPADEAGVVDAVREARASGEAIEIGGGCSRQGFGRPVQAGHTLRLKGVSGVELYRPGELVLRVRAGTPLAEVEATLDEAGQALPFEPPDLRVLLGSDGAVPTVGGLVATNLSGPARIVAGALRDSLIGVRFVDGDGEVNRSGGRVMKNVTGLDLVKLQAGAHGTLGVLTEVTFKVLPKPQDTLTIALVGLSSEAAGEAMRAALATPFEVSAAAYLPNSVAARSGVNEIARADASAVLLRLAYFGEFLPRRGRDLIAALDLAAPIVELPADASAVLWREVRDATLLTEPRERAVWRISTAPTAGPGLLTMLGREIGAEGFFDWAGGLLWLATDAAGDAGAARIRAALEPLGGHATLVRAPSPVRAAVDVFEPQPEPVLALTKRIKASIDPDRLLNPGRMYAGV